MNRHKCSCPICARRTVEYVRMRGLAELLIDLLRDVQLPTTTLAVIAQLEKEIEGPGDYHT